MNKEKVLGLIHKIELSLTAMKTEVSTSGKPKHLFRKELRRKTTSGNKRQGSTEPIKTLIDSDFFKKSKTDIEVVSALKKKALQFARKDIATTLMRFVRKEILEREGDGIKGNPWRYKKI